MSVITVTLEVNSREQEALLRQFHGLLEEMQQLALAAPHGRVLDVCEAAVLQRGQEVSRQVLEQAVQQRIAALEKKGRRCEAALVGEPAKTVDRPNVK
jgi:hypothetical protein